MQFVEELSKHLVVADGVVIETEEGKVKCMVVRSRDHSSLLINRS